MLSRQSFRDSWLSHRRAELVYLVLCLLELGSWFGWQYPVVGSFLTIGLGLVWLWVAARDAVLGAIYLVAELILGSQGYWYALTLAGDRLSLRFVLYCAAIGYLIWRTLTRRQLELLRTRGLKWMYAGALAALGWGLARGWYLGSDPANIFLDVNGYLYLGLFPLFWEAAQAAGAGDKTARVLRPILIWLAFKTMVALYLFSHIEAESLITFYRWWRQTGFGEITWAGGGLYRIFAQSQVYAALAASLGLAWLWQRLVTGYVWRRDLWVTLFVWLMLVTTVASLSRSFWLGLALAWMVVPLARGFKLGLWCKYLGVSLVLVAAAAGAVLATTRLNWPLRPIAPGQAATLAQRLGVGEPAAQSRLQLLPPLLAAIKQSPWLGRGWGATVTYYSADPRLVRSTAGGSGLTTTYAFEWGYFDLWLKLGLIGLVAYLAFIARGLGAAALAWTRGLQVSGLAWAGLVALLGLNLTTPYLNHPLGLGAVMALTALALARTPA